ncbi:hypothetical protein NBE98_20415 [Clostridium swellfunianum]|uniref:hypothetical protein n=1 Tax=Clostridium swellfunianum TaxID=1367462 RepID=UPI002030F61C|nr:hypothetical protein [Clostridium swellfunianum]MCM0650725.1 hypothetical protein [Clostridium swellfunianum]
MIDKNKKLEKDKNVVFAFVLLLLIISTVYAAYMLFNAPSGIAQNEYERVKSDYVLMILQCVLGCIIIFLPSKVEHLFHIDIPDLMEIIYFIFLFCAIYLGEVRNFYLRIAYWDVILHCFSAAMLGAVGFMIVNILNSSEKISIQLSPFFVALFAFSFAILCGTVWEIYEFTADGILGTNMQKFMSGNRTLLVGREALLDTMEDLVVDCFGALIVTMIGYFDLRKKHLKLELK